MKHRCALVAVSLLAVAGCGTTVPLASQQTANVDGGLGPAPALTTGATSAPGNALPTGSLPLAPSALPGTGASATAPATASQAPSVVPRRTTSPITIGFLGAASADAAVGAVGAGGGGGQEPEEAFGYFVSRLNAAGGVNGRQVKVVTAFIDPISTSYETQAAAACAKFTQDNHVAAVFAAEGYYYSEGFSACLSRARVPELAALAGGTDAATLAKYPTLLSPTAPSVERRFAALVRGLAGNGYLSKASKIGVVVEDCPHNLRAYSSTLGPALQRLGATVTKRTVSCVHGFGDAAAFITSIQGQVLPLRSAGVDRVIFMTGFEQIAGQFFEQQSKQQGWKPHYALTSAADTGRNTMQFSEEAQTRLQGVGWEPALDVTAMPTGTAGTRRCVALWKGYAPAASRTNRQVDDTTCDLFFLLEAALARTGGDSTASSLLNALLGLGTSYSSALSLGGGTRLGPGQKDAPSLFATFGYGAACHCVAYTSAPKPLA